MTINIDDLIRINSLPERTSSGIHFAVETVTPTKAARWLESNNPHNRTVRQKMVNRLVNEMLAGAWKINGAAIIFDVDGNIVDGQHRLWACVESNTSFQTVVINGVAPDSFATIDTGKPRTSGDVLYVAGHRANPTRLSAAAGLCIRYLSNWRGVRNEIPKHKILEFVESNPDLANWVSKAVVKSPVQSSSSLLAALGHLASYRYPTAANDFVDMVIRGENMEAGDPPFTLRNRILVFKNERQDDRFHMMILAWNAFHDNRKMTRLMVRSDTFPTIIGAPAVVGR